MAVETIQVERYKVGELYSRAEMAAVGQVAIPTNSRDPLWSTGIIRFQNATFLLVTLQKEGEFDYVDYFDGSLFWWQSQNQQTQSSPAIRALALGDVQAHLFVRVNAKVSGKTERFVYCGRLSAPDLEGERPVTALFEVLEYVPNATGALADVYAWSPKGVAVAPAEQIRQKVIVTRRASGQGRVTNTKLRKLVEAYAMRAAVKHYQDLGWQVTDVSALNPFGSNPYDLLCEKGTETIRVEVKGTQSAGLEVLVTAGEVNAARNHGVRTDLFVFHSIAAHPKGNDEWDLAGGALTLIEKWSPKDSDLSPTAFSYKVSG